MNKIKLALIDDDRLVVQLLSEYFNSQPSIQVTLTAFSGNSFLEKLSHSESPDVIILDLRMKDGDGVKVLEQLKKQKSDLKIIVLSSYYKPSYMGYMIKSGVHAFLPKEVEKEVLVEVINEVYSRGHYFADDQLEILREQVNAKSTPHLGTESKDHLTARELEVLTLLCQQLTAKEIAEKLFVTTKTIEAHKGNLILKTGAKNTGGLIIYAVQNGIVNPDELIIIG